MHGTYLICPNSTKFVRKFLQTHSVLLRTEFWKTTAKMSRDFLNFFKHVSVCHSANWLPIFAISRSYTNTDVGYRLPLKFLKFKHGKCVKKSINWNWCFEFFDLFQNLGRIYYMCTRIICRPHGDLSNEPKFVKINKG